MLCCSPVCEKQALFALFQSYKENNIEEQLIKKVLLELHLGWRREGMAPLIRVCVCLCVCVRYWAVCAASLATAA